MPDLSFDLMAQKLEEAKRAACRRFNEELFRDVVTRPMPPPTWRQRMAWTFARIRAYVSTLGRAVRGDDPYDVESDW